MDYSQSRICAFRNQAVHFRHERRDGSHLDDRKFHFFSFFFSLGSDLLLIFFNPRFKRIFYALWNQNKLYWVKKTVVSLKFKRTICIFYYSELFHVRYTFLFQVKDSDFYKNLNDTSKKKHVVTMILPLTTQNIHFCEFSKSKHFFFY